MTATADQNDFYRQQADFFDAWAERFANQARDAAVEERLSRVCDLAKVVEADRVVDVGTGCGVMIPYLLRRGVPAHHILGVDLSEKMLEVARARYPASHFACRNFVHLGPADEVFLREAGATLILFNACFGNIPDPVQAIRVAARLTRHEGRLVISHPQGRRRVGFLRERERHIVPNQLPSEAFLRSLIGDMPLEITAFVDELDFYCGILQVKG